MDPLAVPVREVARMSGLSESHLNRLRIYEPNRSPPFFKEGSRVLYPVRGVSEWIAGRTASTQTALGIGQ